MGETHPEVMVSWLLTGGDDVYRWTTVSVSVSGSRGASACAQVLEDVGGDGGAIACSAVGCRGWCGPLRGRVEASRPSDAEGFGLGRTSWCSMRPAFRHLLRLEQHETLGGTPSRILGRVRLAASAGGHLLDAPHLPRAFRTSRVDRHRKVGCVSASMRLGLLCCVSLAAALCPMRSGGGGGAGTPCRPQGVLGSRVVAALVRGAYDVPLRSAPAWMRERASTAGWRPIADAAPQVLG